MLIYKKFDKAGGAMNMPNRKTGIVRIPIYELRIGMCVRRLEVPEHESSFRIKNNCNTGQVSTH